MLTTPQSLLVALFIQALLYGVYLATLIQCCRWLIFVDEGWKLRGHINSVMTFATIFIFLMSTINLATGLQGSISIDAGGTVMMMMSNISENLALITIDGLLIYRCWVVYGKSWRVICAPVTFWLASLACSVLQSYYGELLMDNEGQGYISILDLDMKALTGLYACNIAITIYTTAAIIYRIWSSTRNSLGTNHQRLNYAMRVLGESGILYTAMIIFSLVGASIDARKDVTLVDFLISICSDNLGFCTACISFNLILIRVYQSRVELRDSFPDSRDCHGLSGNQPNNLQIAAPSEGPSSNALEEADEI